MATLERRLLALEKSTNTAPLVVMFIDGPRPSAGHREHKGETLPKSSYIRPYIEPKEKRFAAFFIAANPYLYW